jgi:pyridoxine 5-phosphate synthase
LIKLGVNVDHVANIRQARKALEPDPVTAAMLAELAGAHCITVHLRADRRHIQERDLELLRSQVKTKLNLEMSATPEMIAIAGRIKPDMITLVPERPEEVTTEGGLNVSAQKSLLQKAIGQLQAVGIRMGIFIDPDQDQAQAAKEVGAEYIEIHTGLYAGAKGEQQQRELQKIIDTAKQAAELGLAVNAGHDLTYDNVTPIAAIPQIAELNIGHNIVARAVMVGMERAVSQMLDLIQTARRGQ